MAKVKKRVARLPSILPGVTLIQPNKITQTSFKGFTLTMHRIFTALILQLQDSIKQSMKSPDVLQLDLFKDTAQDIHLKIPYKTIIRDKTHYGEVRKALKALSTVSAEIPYTDEFGNSMLRITGLLKADVPEVPNYSSEIAIYIDKRMAKLLVEIDKNDEHIPINFTKYSYEVAQGATTTHTPPLYKLISSWKQKGGLTISLAELRNILGIGESQYKRYYDFQKKVLEPVQEDLKRLGDCWFNCRADGFKTQRKNEIWLNFKIITPERKEEIDKKTAYIYNMLRNYGLNDSQLKTLDPVMYDETIDRQDIIFKISEIAAFIEKNNANPNKPPIISKDSYMASSILKNYLPQN